MRKKKPPQNRRIPSVAVPGAKTLQFSFKHLDTENSKFPVRGCTDEFWESLVRELKRYSQFTSDDFVDQANSDGRHTIDFSETTETGGFASLPAGEDETAWQFALGSRHRRWRVIGFIAEDTFFVVWLDSDHALYSIS